MANFDQNKIQGILQEMGFDAWLFYDFRGSNQMAHAILDMPADAHLTRRFFYLVPAQGTPVKIVNSIEAFNLDHLPGEKRAYASHESLSNHLKETLSGLGKIAMEYSPMNAIPYVSAVDAGTLEFLRSLGADIHSSADLISMFGARWTEEQYQENIPVAYALNQIVKDAFGYIAKETFAGNTPHEYEVQQFIMDAFKSRGYFTDHPPIVGVNGNGANPHYAPDKDTYDPIREGDFVLIDLWAKVDRDQAVWSDITWVGYMGDSVPEKYTKVAHTVFEARDKAFNLVKDRFEQGQEVRGYEVDAAARKHIVDAGYGEYFVHRTGHSITHELHGSGAHMDNFETKDERLILPSTSFSIEPGIYLPDDFGVRSEIDVYVSPEGKVVSTGGDPQTEVIPILKR